MNRRGRNGGQATAPILFAHHGLDWITGSERCLLDLVTHIDRTRFSPVVLCDSPALATAARALNVPVHESKDWIDNEDRLWPTRARVRVISDIVRLHDIQLIHANDTDPLNVLIAAARGAHIPILAHLHIPLDVVERRWSWLHQASMAVGVSEFAVRDLRTDGVRTNWIRVIHNGIDPSRVAEGSATGLRRELGIPPGDVILTSAASLIHRKGVDVLLHAMHALHQRNPSAHLLLLGDGPELISLKSLSNELGIDSHVHFLGRRADVGAVYRDASDVAVSASRMEMLPLSLLEAAMAGLPVVASDIDAHLEAVVEGVTGLLVRQDDPAQLASALDRLAADKNQRVEMGAAGQARALAHFHINTFVAAFERSYEELLSQPRHKLGWVGGSRWPRTYWSWLRSAVTRHKTAS